MKKIIVFYGFWMLLILTGCSNSVNLNSPDYIKKAFTFYSSMDSVMNDVDEGKKITKIYNLKNEKEITKWLQNNHSSSIEKESGFPNEKDDEVISPAAINKVINDEDEISNKKEYVVASIDEMHKVLRNIYNAQSQVDKGQQSTIDEDKEFSKYSMAKFRLVRVFAKYGYKPNKSNFEIMKDGKLTSFGGYFLETCFFIFLGIATLVMVAAEKSKKFKKPLTFLANGMAGILGIFIGALVLAVVVGGLIFYFAPAIASIGGDDNCNTCGQNEPEYPSDNNPGVHSVNGYYRSDGTYVHSYIRSNPDGNPSNNLNP